MDTDLIRTFLTLAQCNSFSTAAEKLTISQSTLSHRLHQLEEELGNILVCRNRGKRNFHLTEAGLEFIPLAEDWMHLSRSIKGFHLERRSQMLRIGSIESISMVMSPFYKRLLNDKGGSSPLHLFYTTSPSFKLYDSLEAHQLDVALVVRKRRSPLLVTDPLFSEEHYVVGDFGNHPQPIDPTTLPPGQELLADWSPDFEPWHQEVFGSSASPLATVDTSQALLSLLGKETWSIIPEAFALYLKDSGILDRLGLFLYELTTPPPRRVTYKVTHRDLDPVRKELLTYFEKELDHFVSATGFTLRAGNTRRKNNGNC